MRNLRLSVTAVVCAALVMLTGCQDENVNPDLDEAVISIDEGKFQITDLNGLENPTITGATEIVAFSTGSTGSQRESHKLAYILRKLNLNERQRKAVRKYVEEHEACVAEHHRSIRQLHEELLKRANAAREDYIKAYRAGKISKQDLDLKLKELHEKLKQEIKEHKQRQLHLQVMRRCRAELFAKIESVLNREQLAKWTEWKRHL